ncbi:hypothetical protein HHK36_028210 [Tetracentron sinense]|uniref:Plant heme peroxidase family profile domain-containing protein n=1 Tax=Tetracentron sinense TaxID=13715 RepID=A0A834YI24_TETSI|nr:hypothetical protein HHK36_028210 [Tetracentron sinense]
MHNLPWITVGGIYSNAPPPDFTFETLKRADQAAGRGVAPAEDGETPEGALVGARVGEALTGVDKTADPTKCSQAPSSTQMQGPHWEVEKGRRDGRISVAANAEAQMPHGELNLTDLVHRFQSKGLTPFDLVTLSGAHSVGFSHCKEFETRTHSQDPTLNSTLRQNLIDGCQSQNVDPNVVQPLDQQTPFEFDNLYFKNLRHQMGLLTSDQVLFSGGEDQCRKLVYRYAEDERVFFSAFAAAMHKLGRIGVKTGMEGEIRKDCTRFN